jgi:hypothetical protein
MPTRTIQAELTFPINEITDGIERAAQQSSEMALAQAVETPERTKGILAGLILAHLFSALYLKQKLQDLEDLEKGIREDLGSQKPPTINLP